MMTFKQYYFGKAKNGEKNSKWEQNTVYRSLRCPPKINTRKSTQEKGLGGVKVNISVQNVITTCLFKKFSILVANLQLIEVLSCLLLQVKC